MKRLVILALIIAVFVCGTAVSCTNENGSEGSAGQQKENDITSALDKAFAHDPTAGDLCEGEKAPLVFYHGNTVAAPGNVVTVSGEYLDTVTALTVGGAEAELIQPNKNSFKFVVPQSLSPAAYECVMTGEGLHKTIVINAPEIVWIQGDEGSIATPGGWLRVCGECLSVAEASPALRLTDAEGKSVYLTESRVLDEYSVEFAVPAGTAAGEYTARYYNGFAISGDDAVTIAASPRDAWPTAVFNIIDYGGKPNDYEFDNGTPLRDALEAVKENGGGVIYFPKGFYHMNSASFTIPANTVLRGEGMNLVSLYWGGPAGSPWTPDSLPMYIFRTATGNCAIEDMTFTSALMPEFFDIGQGKKYNSMAENVYVERCRIWSNLLAGTNGVPKETPGLEDGFTAEQLDRYAEKDTMMFFARCENFQLTDCELEWDSEIIGRNDRDKCGYLKNSLISGNTVSRNGFYGMYDGAIFEDNTMTGATISGIFDFCINGEKCYFARNSITPQADGGDREVICSDWNGATDYCGAVTFKDDTHVVFPEEAEMLYEMRSFEESYFFPRMAVMIVDGTGVGQYRYITYREKGELTLESPFDVWDETSVFTANRLNDHWYFVDNKIDDAGVFCFYTAQMNTVVDGTETTFSEGFLSYGQNVYGGIQSDWYISYVNNVMREGTYYGRFGSFGANDIYRTRMQINSVVDHKVTLSMTIRDNQFYDMSQLKICAVYGAAGGSDMVIEDNSFTDGDTAINFCSMPCLAGTVLSGNRFERCDTEIVYPTTPEDYTELD